MATATMLRVALFARRGAARGAGRLVGGRLVDAGLRLEGAQAVDESGPQNHPTTNAMAPKVDQGQNRFSATGDSLLFCDTCAVLRKCFKSRAVADKSGCVATVHMVAIHMQLVPCTLRRCLNGLEAVRQSPHITGPSAESASMATSWDVAAKTGDRSI